MKFPTAAKGNGKGLLVLCFKGYMQFTSIYINTLLALFMSVITLKNGGNYSYNQFSYWYTKFQTLDTFFLKLHIQHFQYSNDFIQLYKGSSRKYIASKFHIENLTVLKYPEIVYYILSWWFLLPVCVKRWPRSGNLLTHTVNKNHQDYNFVCT